MRGIKLLLEAFGIQINPVEVEQAFEKAKDALPQLANAANQFADQLKRIEAKQDEILNLLRIEGDIHVSSDSGRMVSIGSHTGNCTGGFLAGRTDLN